MYFDTTYTNGVIAVKEKSLLKDKISRLCEVSADEAFRMLLESGFGGGATENAYEYETLLQSETSALDAFIRTYAPSKTEQEYFLLPRDFHNAKALLKAKVLGGNADKMLVPEGLVAVETLQACIDEKRYEKLDSFPALKEACKEGTETLETDVSGIKLGSIFERKLYEALTQSVCINRVLRKLLSLKIDMTNILTALRSGEETVAKKQYLSGGSLSEKKLQVLYTDDTDKIRRTFAGGEFSEFIALCMTAKEKNEAYVEAEKYRDSYDLSSLEKRKFDLIKGEPFLYYVYRKKSEIANVRIIMACKYAGLDETQIKNRLRK